MTTMISEVYSAFKTAGVPEQEAKQAAETLSAENLATSNTIAENRRELSAEITASKQELAGQVGELRQDVGELRQEVNEVKQEVAEFKLEFTERTDKIELKLSGKIAEIRHEMTVEMGKMQRGMGIIQWMLGLVLFAVALPILREIIVI